MNEYYDVLIVGAGPVGLIAANLLELLGVNTLLIERDENPYPFPRAITIDDETIRILRLIGIEQTEIDEITRAVQVNYFSPFGYRFLDATLEEFDSYRPYGYPLVLTHIQPELEKLLRNPIKTAKNVIYKLGCEFKHFISTDEKTVVSLLNDNGIEKRITSHYVLACDGGKSIIREQLEIKFNALSENELWVVIDLYDNEIIRDNIQKLSLSEPLKRPFVSLTLPKNMRRFEIKLENEKLVQGELSEKDTLEILAPFLKNANASIIRSKIYLRHYFIAEDYRKGNIFLLGDAAHLVPPYGGQGMCSGIKDAANLCWKIACIQENGKQEILASYFTERKQNAYQVIEFVKTVQMNVIGDSNRSSQLGIDFYKNIKPKPFYTEGFIGSTAHAGAYLNYFEIELLDHLYNSIDAISNYNFLLLFIDANLSDQKYNTIIQQWSEFGGKLVNLHSKKNGSLSDNKNVIDAFLKNWKNYIKLEKNTVFIVRPDKFIFDSFALKDTEKYVQHFIAALKV